MTCRLDPLYNVNDNLLAAPGAGFHLLSSFTILTHVIIGIESAVALNMILFL